jgi:CRP/FNR family transcriptional regulator
MAFLSTLESGQRRHFVAGAYLFRPGMSADFYLRVETGVARVQLLSDSGRELILYRLHPGQSCVLTTSCLFAQAPYPAEGLAETLLEVTLWPVRRFHQLFAESESFRTAVMENYAQRLAELLGRVSVLMFEGLDRRLARLLIARAERTMSLVITHAALARELSVQRESVSRQLKRLERYGLVRLGRNRIEVVDRARLAGIASCVTEITDDADQQR